MPAAAAAPPMRAAEPVRDSRPQVDSAPVDGPPHADDLALVKTATFSPMMLGLFAVLLVIGLIFGWTASVSINSNKLYNAQTADAERILQSVKPKVDNFETALERIKKLSGTTVDFEAASELAKADFAIDAGVFGDNLLLGPALVGQLTDYMVNSALLRSMLAEHNYMTNTVDKKELEQIGENNQLLDKENFAVLFDYNYLAKNSGSDSYEPRAGRLVTVASLEKDADGKIEVEFLHSNDTAKTLIQGILPLAKSELLKSGGPDALQRYQKRLELIMRMSQQVDAKTRPMLEGLEKLSSRDSSGIF